MSKFEMILILAIIFGFGTMVGGCMEEVAMKSAIHAEPVKIRKAVAECEKNLPRTQNCKLIAVPDTTPSKE